MKTFHTIEEAKKYGNKNYFYYKIKETIHGNFKVISLDNEKLGAKNDKMLL